MSELLRLDNVTICYPHLFETHAPPGTTNAKFSVESILDPTNNPAHAETCQRIQDAFVAVATAAGKADNLQYLKSPLKNGDVVNQEQMAKGKKPREELAGKYLIRSSEGTYAPQIVDQNLQPISPDNRAAIFGGCICNVFIDLYWSSNQANPGVYAGVKGVQLVNNVGVTAIGGTGAMSADQMFQQVEGAPAPLAQPGATPSWQ